MAATSKKAKTSARTTTASTAPAKSTPTPAQSSPIKAVPTPVQSAPAKVSAVTSKVAAITPTHHEIAQLAQRYWAERGHQDGYAEQDWLRAEHELRKKAS